MAKSEPILQQIVLTRSAWGARVFADGRVDEYSDEETAPGDDFSQTLDVAPEWRSLTKLPQEEVERLRSEIRDSGFFNLPSRIEPSRHVYDGVTTSWRADLDGVRHEVTARGSEGQRALQKLNDLLQELIGEALNREADGKKAPTGRSSGSSEVC